MPVVGSKHFAYTEKGKKEAKEYAQKKQMPVQKMTQKKSGRGK